MKHRGWLSIVGVVFVCIAGAVVGFAQTKDAAPAHPAPVATAASPADLASDSCAMMTHAVPASMATSSPASSSENDVLCQRCVAPADFCKDVLEGTPCGKPACGGVCRGCNGHLDCFKR